MLRRSAFLVPGFARLSCVCSCLAAFLTISAIAQTGSVVDPRPIQFFEIYDTTPGTGVFVFTVSAEHSGAHLDRQAMVKLTSRSTASSTWQTTQDNSRAIFASTPYGSYDVEVSAVGYLSAQKEVQVTNSLGPSLVEIIVHRDPDAIHLDGSDEMMSPKARKQTKHAVSALKSGKLQEAQKHLDDAYKLSPSSPELNFLLGYLYFQKKDFNQAGAYLGTAASLSHHNAQTLTLLGRTGLERQDYPAARSALEQAILADNENWLSHNLLADAYLHQQDYDKARDEAQIAIDKGKNRAAPAQLVLGEALVNLGQDQEGLLALNLFLEQAPQHPLAPQVRTLIAEIQEHPSRPASSDETPKTQARLAGVDPLAALAAPALTLKSWMPPGIDEVKLAVAPGVECPSAQVIDESGKRVQELVDDVSRFAAVEDLLHQSLNDFGIPVRTETRKYNYVASISEPQPGFLAVDEFRADRITPADYPDNIASTGFAALALVFHPHMRDNFAMTCEGLGDWHGQATWLVRFRQRDDRPNRMHSYKVGDQMYSVDLQGQSLDHRRQVPDRAHRSRNGQAAARNSACSASTRSSSTAPSHFPRRTLHSGFRRAPKFISTSASIATIAVTVSITTCSTPSTPTKSAKNP